jgi:hypothetical protein
MFTSAKSRMRKLAEAGERLHARAHAARDVALGKKEYPAEHRIWRSDRKIAMGVRRGLEVPEPQFDPPCAQGCMSASPAAALRYLSKRGDAHRSTIASRIFE